jgi:hypothetical protein
MSAIRFADLLRARITEKVQEHHTSMDKGAGPEQYLKLVGRQQQLKEVRGWITDALNMVDSEEGEDDL